MNAITRLYTAGSAEIIQLRTDNAQLRDQLRLARRNLALAREELRLIAAMLQRDADQVSAMVALCGLAQGEAGE